MNTKSFMTQDYEKNHPSHLAENKPNTNPIPQKGKMNVNLFATKDYENEPLWGINPIKLVLPVPSKVEGSLACPERSRMGRMDPISIQGRQQRMTARKKNLDCGRDYSWSSPLLDVGMVILQRPYRGRVYSAGRDALCRGGSGGCGGNIRDFVGYSRLADI